MKKKLIIALQPIVPSTPAIHIGVLMQQLRPQLSLVNNSISVNQHPSWQQLVTPLIARQPRVVPYPPYPMWYNILPSFVPMDLYMYPTYYFEIKGPNPLIVGKKKGYVIPILIKQNWCHLLNSQSRHNTLP
jgi:hypothetical protein